MSEAADLDTRLLAQMRQDFLAESGEILEQLGSWLVRLETGGTPDTIDTIFRQIHTLKGSASFVGLDVFQRLAHKLEDLFGAVRNDELAVTPELMDVAFAGVQLLITMRRDVAAGGDGQVEIASLVARVEAALRGEWTLEQWPRVLPGDREAEPDASLAQGRETTLRVEVGVVDSLLALAGELITARNALQVIVRRFEDESLHAEVDGIDRLANQVQDLVSSMRLVPIERLFTRFTPVVWTLAREHGKQVRLVVDGGDTPLDRVVSEQMYEPLIHLLRNAVDHGLEPPPARQRAGKPAEGTLRLSAERCAGHVVLRISDDGRGIDLAHLRQAALERNLYSQRGVESLTDDQVLRLIFAPGFSTSTTVTATSGRGVGLDVVAQNVRRLRGSLDVETSRGQGTTFIIQLPLTLAVLHVLLVRVGAYTYALPLHAVRETLQVTPASIQIMPPGQVIWAALPVHRLVSDPALRVADLPRVTDSLWAVVVHLSQGDRVFVVDELLAKQQLVITPLSPYLGQVVGVEGAAILPDGSVTLVLDLDELSAGRR